MFENIPVELIEQILLNLDIQDIYNFFTAFNKTYHFLPHYFWKKICLREHFKPTNNTQEWCECFKAGVNRKLGLYTILETVPSGVIEHVYFKIVITRLNYGDTLDTYIVYILDKNNKFNLVQIIDARSCQFMEDFVIVKNEFNVSILMYSISSNIFECLKEFPEEDQPTILGITNTHYLCYNQKYKCFNLCAFEDNIELEIKLPSDVKFVTNTIFHKCTNRIVISVLTLENIFKIKVFDLDAQAWTLDLFCFRNSGICNAPNVWVGENFLGCCDVSYRIQGNYYGPFKVWDVKGNPVFQVDIETYKRDYLQCFFKEEYIILTTSEKTIKTFIASGRCITEIQTTTAILDIKLSPKHMMFVLLENNEFVEVYDWKGGCKLYTIKLRIQCTKSLSSDYIYSAKVNKHNNIYEVVSFV